jgi:trans-aconitate methyltransferase
MIAEARQRFPNLHLVVMDATAMNFAAPFDAIFSNAALHWIKPPQAAAARMFAALKPGGRLVVEFGGSGNVQKALEAAAQAGREIGVNVDAHLYINYFPSIGEYAMLLQQAGFEVAMAELFDRPTPLQGDAGLRNWIHMFRSDVLQALPADKIEPFFLAMERIARPVLFTNRGWSADYRRLRIVAHRPRGS